MKTAIAYVAATVRDRGTLALYHALCSQADLHIQDITNQMTGHFLHLEQLTDFGDVRLYKVTHGVDPAQPE